MLKCSISIGNFIINLIALIDVYCWIIYCKNAVKKSSFWTEFI